MNIRVDRVDVSDSGEGCEVLFGDGEDPGSPYVLLQRHFEESGGDLLYVETHDLNYAGHVQLPLATLCPGRFRMEWKRTREWHLEVMFEVTAQQYRELERVLRILVPGLKMVGSLAH